MSLELSKEMLMVQGYLGDAKLLVDQQLGKIAPERVGGVVVEIAKMLQQERHHIHKKAPPTPSAKSTQSSSPKTDQVMASARNNPQVPMMVSASDTEPAPRKSRPRKIAPKVRKPEPKKRVEKRTSKPRRR